MSVKQRWLAAERRKRGDKHSYNFYFLYFLIYFCFCSFQYLGLKLTNRKVFLLVIFLKNMAWKKLNNYADMWEKPVLGSEKQEDGRRFMALCVDPTSKTPYRGIARQVIDRQGSPDVPGFLDRSKLIIVESDDLLIWRIKCDLNIKGIYEVIKELNSNGSDEKEFIGFEDPDILVDETGKKHVYFTIPFRYKGKDWYDVYVGHAEGHSLEGLIATKPVLEEVNSEIVGFKEICPSPITKKGARFVLAETFVDRGGERKYSAVSVSIAKNLSDVWVYKKIVHDPEKEDKKWCAGHSSPCRIFNPSFLSHKNYLVGIMNGREPTKKVDGGKIYGKFRPGLFLFDGKSGDIVWVANEPLFEDPAATTVTFASDLVYLSKDEAILYAHPNDSFVRAYRLKASKIKGLLPANL